MEEESGLASSIRNNGDRADANGNEKVAGLATSGVPVRVDGNGDTTSSTANPTSSTTISADGDLLPASSRPAPSHIRERVSSVDRRDLMQRIRGEGIQVTLIGEVLAPGKGIEAKVNDQPAEWPRFEVDEIARLF